MSKIDATLFAKVAREIVPGLRRATEEMGFELGQVSPSVSMTATIDVDGTPARVRLQVTLDPDEDEAD
jgi:hypothetical protein